MPNFVENWWNDRVSSIKSSKEFEGSLYQDTYYDGGSNEVLPRSNIGNVANNYNDWVSSLTINLFDGVISYEYSYFGGSRHWIWCYGTGEADCAAPDLEDDGTKSLKASLESGVNYCHLIPGILFDLYLYLSFYSIIRRWLAQCCF